MTTTKLANAGLCKPHRGLWSKIQFTFEVKSVITTQMIEQSGTLLLHHLALKANLDQFARTLSPEPSLYNVKGS